MIRTTYRGRAIKVLAARGKPGHVKTIINGQTINHAWQGDDAQALNWFKQIIDQMDAAGGPGNCAHLYYTAPHWWEPGTFDVNPNGCATQPGGFCLCTRCVIGDVGGGKARYAPLHPDACQHCHQLADNHDDDVHLEWHRYTEPTAQQRAGRQAFIDDCKPSLDDDDEDPPCGAVYHKDHPGHINRPQCMLFADHRDAAPGYEDRHVAGTGFMWPREAAS
jgi:hypothetical protein